MKSQEVLEQVCYKRRILDQLTHPGGRMVCFLGTSQHIVPVTCISPYHGRLNEGTSESHLYLWMLSGDEKPVPSCHQNIRRLVSGSAMNGIEIQAPVMLEYSPGSIICWWGQSFEQLMFSATTRTRAQFCSTHGPRIDVWHKHAWEPTTMPNNRSLSRLLFLYGGKEISRL